MSHQRKSKIVTPKDEWGTPQWLFDLLDQEFHFQVDAAANERNALCGWFMDAGGEFDALKLPSWLSEKMPFVKTFFLNPPYSAALINAFMKKAYEESLKGAVVVCLVPAATDTKWWHNYAMKAQEIRFIKGRVRFVGFDEQGNEIRQSPTFPSCVVIFDRNVPEGYARLIWDPPRIGKTIEHLKKSRPQPGQTQTGVSD